MKALKIFLVIIVFLLGYALGNLFPWSGFSFIGEKKNIEGNSKLEVSLLVDNNQPVKDVEIDLAEKPGPPPKGGIAVTNERGIAEFNVQPGNYFIYFNSNYFPKNLQEPELLQVQVAEGQVNKKTITLKTKQN